MHSMYFIGLPNITKLFKLCCAEKEINLLQVAKFKKYKYWNLKVQLCIVIVLSCPLIGC